MKEIFVAALAAVMLAGCASPCIVREYDPLTGKLVKETETTESPIKSITESTKEKTVVAWDNSWLAYISASTATTEDPTPTVKMGVGKADKGVLSLHKSHKVDHAAAIITAARAGELSVTKDGAASKSSAEAAK